MASKPSPLTKGARKSRSKCVANGSGGLKWMSTTQWDRKDWSDMMNHQDNKEDMTLFMNPALLDKSLAADVKVEDTTIAAAAAQAQIAALQAALASQQRQAAAQEEEKLLLQMELLTVADAAEAKAQNLREAYEQAAAEAAAAREQAEQAAREAQQVQPVAQPMDAERPEIALVRLKLRGRFYDPNYHPKPVIIPLADGWLPAGCKMLHGVLHGHKLTNQLLKLMQLMEEAPAEEKKAIRSGQPDLRRKQLKKEAAELEICRQFMLPALEEAGELAGRLLPTECNVIQSEPDCKIQRRHYDYTPERVQLCTKGGGRKPASAILALEPGTRVAVYDEERGGDVLVEIPPGSMLIFDGDVAHNGMWYTRSNTRVHLYLDVEGCLREEDTVWLVKHQ